MIIFDGFILMSNYKVTRPQKDLIEALRKHLNLLNDFYSNSFTKGDGKYYGEIAGKLRLLVYEKSQTPLLLSLMEELGIDVPFVLDGPPIKPQPGQPGPGDSISLRKYLKLLAYVIRTPNGLVKVSKTDLVRIWAQQDGSAHEDWKHDQEYAFAKGLGLNIGGIPALAAELKVTTKAVLNVGMKVLEIIDQKKVD